MAAIDKKIEAIERNRREIEGRQARELGEIEGKVEAERARHERELESWNTISNL